MRRAAAPGQPTYAARCTSTYAPILLALPDCRIVEVSEAGLNEVAFDEVEAVQLTRLVLDDPGGMMRRLLGD